MEWWYRMRRSWRPLRVPRSQAWRSQTTQPGAVYSDLRRRPEQRQHRRLQQQVGNDGNSRTPIWRFPAGFTAFNVQNLSVNGTLTLFVTYTNQSIPSGGIVDEFKPRTVPSSSRLINDPTGKWLDNPWGLTIAPQSFGKFGGDLLVGNNGGNNWINAFDPMNGALPRDAYPRLGSTF